MECVFNARYAGKPAGRNRRGYIDISIDGHRYLGHRLAWLYMTGAWPEKEIDHINCNPSDNSWRNLRQATRRQNMCNTRARAAYKGVTWSIKSRKWQAGIKTGGKFYYLGLFDDPRTAHAAYCEAAIRKYGEFARLT
jgi:hypothetical protein